MRKMSVAIILGLISGLLLTAMAATNSPPDITKADGLYDKGTFEQALKEYQKVFAQTPTARTKTKAFCRTIECLAHLYRWGEAAELMIKTSLPRDNADKVRVLLFRAE